MTYRLLKGTRVLESSAFIAAPLSGLTLAQLGADVIRVDAIGGGIDYGRLPIVPGGRSVYWTSLNKGKRSIAIDIRSAEGRELIAALAVAPGENAGILLTNIGTPWLSHDVLASRRADMITCVIEGNFDGSTAVDYTVNCATGYPLITGEGSADRPVNHALPAWDVACALQASTSVVAALFNRRVTGQGAAMRIALSDVAFSVLSHLGLLTEVQVLREEREALGNYIYGAFGRDFATSDGQHVMVAAVSTKQWLALVEACGLATQLTAAEVALGMDFRKEPDRFEARNVISSFFELWFAKHPLPEVAERFDTAGVCWGKYGTIGDLLAHDRRVSSANPMFELMETEGVGQHLSAGAPVRLGGASRKATRPAPWLGADTDEILADVLALPDHAICGLHDRGTVSGAGSDPFSSHEGE